MLNFREFATNVAVVDDEGDRVSYSELEREGDELADSVGKRALVFCLCSNTIGSVLGYSAFLRRRIVPLTLDGRIDRETFERYLATYRPEFVWLSKERAAEWNIDAKIIAEKRGFVLARRSRVEPFPLFEELALLVPTSGSTGGPKLTRQSYRNLKANADAIVRLLKLDADERPFLALPTNYVFGQSILHSHWTVGATIILTARTIMQREFWNLFDEERATSFSGVPYTFEMLNKLAFFRRKLPYLKTLTQAGGKLSPELHRRFAEYASREGKNFVVMYGQSEATARIAYLPPERSLEKCGSIGIAIPGGKASLVDADGKTIDKPETEGELVFEGENVTLGYAVRGEDLAKGDERGGVLYTGDLAKVDADGFYTIVGRKSRFLKMFGVRVDLDETERTIRERFPELDCACVGVDDSTTIFVDDASQTKEIQSFVANKLRLNFAGFRVVFIEKIPRNAAGKILYAELNRR